MPEKSKIDVKVKEKNNTISLISASYLFLSNISLILISFFILIVFIFIIFSILYPDQVWWQNIVEKVGNIFEIIIGVILFLLVIGVIIGIIESIIWIIKKIKGMNKKIIVTFLLSVLILVSIFVYSEKRNELKIKNQKIIDFWCEENNPYEMTIKELEKCRHIYPDLLD